MKRLTAVLLAANASGCELCIRIDTECEIDGTLYILRSSLAQLEELQGLQASLLKAVEQPLKEFLFSDGLLRMSTVYGEVIAYSYQRCL